MVNAPGISSQSAPERKERKSEACPPDNKLPENSQENLDARLDHAIEETFPTSDPVSVTVTKTAVTPDQQAGASTASSRQSRDGRDQAEQETAEKLLDQVREAMQDVAQTASGTVREAYHEGQHYLRQARDRYPKAERSYQESRRLVRQQITANPWPWLLMAGAVGYALAWMIHGEARGRERHVPEYARTRRGYTSHRDDQHEE
ncbi:hypothetical protein [Microvirga vignae]|uniref:hypothetical protein n=1 Tax=Microvirga vignae TaxID=1225564 RepID=UPI0009FEB5D4|nr:hypothetical protein [Microvirga vignae]